MWAKERISTINRHLSGQNSQNNVEDSNPTIPKKR